MILEAEPVEADHVEFEQRISALERRSDEQTSQLRRIQIELGLFEPEEASARDHAD